MEMSQILFKGTIGSLAMPEKSLPASSVNRCPPCFSPRLFLIALLELVGILLLAASGLMLFTNCSRSDYAVASDSSEAVLDSSSAPEMAAVQSTITPSVAGTNPTSPDVEETSDSELLSGSQEALQSTSASDPEQTARAGTSSSSVSAQAGWVAAHSPPTRIVIQAIGLDAPVVEVAWKTVERNGKRVSEWETADHAAGFHKYSAYPGQGGNTVLSGHHNIKGEVFRDLVKLQPGDEILLYAEQREYHYQVADNFILREAGVSEEERQRNARWIAPTADERLTLVTCWPYTSNTHRVIVVARPVP